MLRHWWLQNLGSYNTLSNNLCMGGYHDNILIMCCGNQFLYKDNWYIRIRNQLFILFISFIEFSTSIFTSFIFLCLLLPNLIVYFYWFSEMDWKWNKILWNLILAYEFLQRVHNLFQLLQKSFGFSLDFYSLVCAWLQLRKTRSRTFYSFNFLFHYLQFIQLFYSLYVKDTLYFYLF